VTGNAEVEALLDDHTDAVAATVRRLRAVVRTAHPRFVERVRPGWHSINYHDPVAGFVCAIFPATERVQLVLEHGARLPDPEARLSGDGKQVRTLDFPAGADVDEDVVVPFLDLAVELGAALRRR
jgi:hypothetical protein